MGGRDSKTKGNRVMAFKKKIKPFGTGFQAMYSISYEKCTWSSTGVNNARNRHI